MRSEGYCSRPVCQSVCPGLFSATHATTRPSRHTYGLSIVLAPGRIWRFSYNGLVSKIAIALPYTRAHGSRPFLYARIFTRAVTYYTRMRTNDVSIVLQFVCIEFRRGFCTLVSSFSMSFASPRNVSMQGISSPPCGRSCE